MGLMHIVTLLCVLSVNSLAISATLNTYIVHVESPQSGQTHDLATEDADSPNAQDLDDYYRSFIPATTISSGDLDEEKPRITHSYHNIFPGFSAKLSAEDVKAMSEKPGFISASVGKNFSLFTTHTPSFLGLHQNFGFWNRSNYGKGVIIGVLDTGINPGHPSFNDDGVPPPPKKWKGKCVLNGTACNNKLIGAQSFITSIIGTTSLPTDIEGHGTHTSSTAAGNFVRGANLLGNANGTAAGVAPLAHLAMYQVCGLDGCREDWILAGMDAAISDGVDVLSLSLGGPSKPFYSDNLAVGAYSAIKKGIFVSCAAGNNGSAAGTLSNEAPWVLTVGASTTDRKLKATAVLGNKVQLDGQSIYQPKNFSSDQFPLYYPGLDPNDQNADRNCTSLRNDTNVKGKIVVCERGINTPFDKSNKVENAGGIGIIILNSEISAYTVRADPHSLPGTHLSYADGRKLASYMNSTRFPTAAISFKGTVFGDPHAPQVASFSSRGPSMASPGIIKPDIIGPGVDILAGWPLFVGVTDTVSSIWNVISGTSMATPHLSGVAALLKSAHPNWSPAAIKSAIMTTADMLNLGNTPIEDETQLPASLYAVGSGHVNPSRASGPGLVYDIHPAEYIPYLCGLKYTEKNITSIVHHKVNCSAQPAISEGELNYPSFTVSFRSGPVQKYSRTVTNVGEAGSVYNVKVVAPKGVDVTVTPRTLHFSRVNQRQTYEVTFKRNSVNSAIALSEGSIIWYSKKNWVRSPIAALLF